MFYCRGQCKKGCQNPRGKSFGHEHWQSHLNEILQPQVNIETLIFYYISNNLNNVSYNFVNTLNIFKNVKQHLSKLIAMKGGENPFS